MKGRMLIAALGILSAACGQIRGDSDSASQSYLAEKEYVPIPSMDDSLRLAIEMGLVDESDMDSLYYAQLLAQTPAEEMTDESPDIPESCDSYDSYDDAYGASQGPRTRPVNTDPRTSDFVYYRTDGDCYAILMYIAADNTYSMAINDARTGFKFDALRRADNHGVSNYYTTDGVLVFSTSDSGRKLDFSGVPLHAISKSESENKPNAVSEVYRKMMIRTINDGIQKKPFYCYINADVYSGRYSGNPDAPLMQSAPMATYNPYDATDYGSTSTSTQRTSGADYANRMGYERAYQGYVDMLNAMKYGTYPYQDGYSMSKVREIQSQMRSVRNEWNSAHPDAPIYESPAESWSGSR